MLKIIKANQRHFKDMGWLQTYWLFSFSEYYDPENVNHGKLRVFNDDYVQPGRGFPTHPHEEMEIITLVQQGEITHKDSMGNEGVIKAGDVQRMSAGTGLTHSEYNTSDKGLAFYQIWIYTDVKGLEPSYEQKSFSREAFMNRLTPVASGQSIPDAVGFHTDATIYRSVLDAGKTLAYPTDADRCLFVYVTSGNLMIHDQRLEPKDQARIASVTSLDIKADEGADFILIDVPG